MLKNYVFQIHLGIFLPYSISCGLLYQFIYIKKILQCWQLVSEEKVVKLAFQHPLECILIYMQHVGPPLASFIGVALY